MQDEARHVAFGRLALRDYYPQLTQAERDEREEFAVEACYLMRDRFLAEEVWETLGLPVEECVSYVDGSRGACATFRSRLFTRIVPTIKDIGLWGPKIRRAYANMGIIGFADIDAEALSARGRAGRAGDGSTAEMKRALGVQRPVPVAPRMSPVNRCANF